ncbi:hypothetical protein [Nocardia brevicatena]|uniref:hypothetical protein n=1 Tax=Nocardia brevicatena TaxID=37327 RepID=UPI0012FBDC7D|nr:hypothetical protein [Nocardia brevicatena]
MDPTVEFACDRYAAARLRISPLCPWTAAERAEVEAEAYAPLGFPEPELRTAVEILDIGADTTP